jgi:hypothetical protein
MVEHANYALFKFIFKNFAYHAGWWNMQTIRYSNLFLKLSSKEIFENSCKGVLIVPN